MNLLTISSLTTFKNNPHIEKCCDNLQRTFLLYGNQKQDKKSLSKIKNILKYHSYHYDVTKNLPLNQVRDLILFKSRTSNCFRPSWLIFPSIYGSSDKAIQNVVYTLTDNKVRDNIDVIPVVYDNQTLCVSGLLGLYRTLNFTSDVKSWWRKLQRSLGRPSGQVHVLLADDFSDDIVARKRIQNLVAHMKSEIISMGMNEQKEMLFFLREELDFLRMIQNLTSSHCPVKLKKYPSAPDVNFASKNKNDTTENTQDSVLGSCRPYDVSPFIVTRAGIHHSWQFLPLNTEVHVYIVYPGEYEATQEVSGEIINAMSKIKTMRRLLNIHGYRCMTIHDIPPGHNIYRIANENWHEKRIATIIIDFNSLRNVPRYIADLAFQQYLETGIKFIPITLLDTDSKPYLNHMHSLDIKGDHREWFPKLLRAINNSVECSLEITHNTRLQRMKLHMTKEISKLHPSLQRFLLSRLLADSALSSFIAQQINLPVMWRSDPVFYSDENVHQKGKHYNMSSSESSVATVSEDETLVQLQDLDRHIGTTSSEVPVYADVIGTQSKKDPLLSELSNVTGNDTSRIPAKYISKAPYDEALVLPSAYRTSGILSKPMCQCTKRCWKLTATICFIIAWIVCVAVVKIRIEKDKNQSSVLRPFNTTYKEPVLEHSIYHFLWRNTSNDDMSKNYTHTETLPTKLPTLQGKYDSLAWFLHNLLLLCLGLLLLFLLVIVFIVISSVVSGTLCIIWGCLNLPKIIYVMLVKKSYLCRKMWYKTTRYP